jgi:hypothetical protein
MDGAEQQDTSALQQQQDISAVQQQQQQQQTGQATDAAQQHHGPMSAATPQGQGAVQARPLDASLLPAPHARPGPTAQQLAAEQAAAASIAAATPPFTLQVRHAAGM